jgi:hypothetical protein
MEYQLKLDKHKARDQFRYTWCGTLWDKGLFAALVAGAVLGGNWLLENYRAEQAREQFLTGKRLEALTDDAAAMSGVTAVYFAHTGTKKNKTEEQAKKDFTKALEHAREIINKSQFLFGDGLNADTDRYYAVLANIKEVSKKQ